MREARLSRRYLLVLALLLCGLFVGVAGGIGSALNPSVKMEWCGWEVVGWGWVLAAACAGIGLAMVAHTLWGMQQLKRLRAHHAPDIDAGSERRIHDRLWWGLWAGWALYLLPGVARIASVSMSMTLPVTIVDSSSKPVLRARRSPDGTVRIVTSAFEGPGTPSFESALIQESGTDREFPCRLEAPYHPGKAGGIELVAMLPPDFQGGELKVRIRMKNPPENDRIVESRQSIEMPSGP